MYLREAVPEEVPAIVEMQRPGAIRAVGHIFPQDTPPFPDADIRADLLVDCSTIPQRVVCCPRVDRR
jgi:hypothetical protein